MMTRFQNVYLRLVWVVAFFGACHAQPSGAALAAEANPTIDLLRAPGAAVIGGSGPTESLVDADRVRDGDEASFATLVASDAKPAEMVFGLGEGNSTLEKLIVRLAEAPSGELVGLKFDLLVSETSPQAGFHAIAIEPLEATTKPQTRVFRPVAARFIRLEISAGTDSKTFAIAQIEAIGHAGPPATAYEFKESPAHAVEVLARLKQSGSAPMLTDDEVSLFRDGADGKFDEWSFAEAALLASGVDDQATRREMLKRVSKWEGEAKKRLVKAKSPFEKGKALLTYLHEGPLAKGYLAEQTDLARVVQEGQFNCVSSALAFNVLARRMGLDARAIEVPSHAFSILYDGLRHADVETTVDRGFNPSRDDAARSELKATTGFEYIPDSHREERREIGETGLVAIVYYNHGVMLTNEKKFDAALLAYFKALSLDPENVSAVKNTLAVLANWSGQLAEEREFAKSLEVLSVGLDLAPQDLALANNRRYAWSRWADDANERGKTAEALDLLTRAADACPDDAGYFASRQSWLFLKGGEEKIDAGQWEEALRVVEPGFTLLSGEPLEELLKWKKGLYGRWSGQAIKGREFEKAARILETAQDAFPEDEAIPDQVAYLIQEWADDSQEKQGDQETLRLLLAMGDRYPSITKVKEVSLNHVARRVSKSIESGDFASAMATIETFRPLYAKWKAEEDAGELAANAYHRQARRLLDTREFSRALDLYEGAQAALPDDRDIPGQIAYVTQEWAKDEQARNGDEKACLALMESLAKFASLAEVQETVYRHVARRISECVDANDLPQALAVTKVYHEALEKAGQLDTIEELTVGAYSRDARARMEQKDFAGAADVYERALGDLPENSDLRDAVAYLTQEWGRHERETAGEPKAAEVLAALVRRFDKIEGVHECALNHVRRWLRALVNEEKFEEAIAAPDEHAELLDLIHGGKDRDDVGAEAYQLWGNTLIDKEDWPAAIAVYEKGLEKFPEASDLKQNLEFCRFKAKPK